MNVLSVCSGIGAPEAAWTPLGWNFVACSEIEPFPSAVLTHHYPDVPNWGDMTKFKEWPDADINVLVGGTPCQSFSVAGLRKGLDDPRGNLALTYLAIADRYRPRWLVWENVPGVLSSNGGRDFGAFLGALGELGYGWSYRVLDAQYFGLAQRRKRVFVVGYLGDWRRAAAVLFEPESLSGHPPPSREAGEEFAAPTAPSLTASGRGVERAGESRGQDPVVAVARSVAVRGRDGVPQIELGDDKANAILTPNGGRAGIGVGAVLAPALTSNPYGDHESREGLVVASEVAMTLNAKGGAGRSDAGSETFVATQITHTLDSYSAGRATEDGTGRNVPLVVNARETPITADNLSLPLGAQDIGHAVINDVHPTLSASTGGGPTSQDWQAHAAVINEQAVRRLMPVECEFLQGFPRGYTAITYRGKPAADGNRYKALGNSMAVPVVRWIGERIATVDSLDLIAEAAE